jgi:hypothetical protein
VAGTKNKMQVTGLESPPLVELNVSWFTVGMFRVSFNPALRGDGVGSSIANVGFLRADIVNVGCGLSAVASEWKIA